MGLIVLCHSYRHPKDLVQGVAKFFKIKAADIILVDITDRYGTPDEMLDMTEEASYDYLARKYGPQDVVLSAACLTWVYDSLNRFGHRLVKPGGALLFFPPIRTTDGPKHFSKKRLIRVPIKSGRYDYEEEGFALLSLFQKV